MSEKPIPKMSINDLSAFLSLALGQGPRPSRPPAAGPSPAPTTIWLPPPSSRRQ